MKRYTKSELKKISDIQLAINIVNERKNSLKNPYSPLSNKLRKVVQTLEQLENSPVIERHGDERK